jgi:hypothetical protein
MESHYFSEAIPCGKVSSSHNSLPTWTVHVIRCKGDVTVGTLTVNADTLPPRLNPKTKKSLWKLPDSIDVLPRFGEHEKKRLWELHKEIKKERRRKNKEDEHSATTTTDAPSPTTATTRSENCVNGMATLSLADDTEPSAPLHASLATTATTRQTAPQPPPGFATSATSATLPMISTARKPVWPPPTTSTTTTTTAVTTKTLPTRTSVSSPVHSLHPQAYFVVPVVPVESSPTASSPIATTNDDDENDDDRAMAIGSIVAGAFLETMASLAKMDLSSTTTLSSSAALEAWLAYYSRTATKSLLLGSATAKANAPELIRQQWQSLMAPGCLWQCHGWIAQAVVVQSSSWHTDNHTNSDGPATPPIHHQQQQQQQTRDIMATLVTFTGQTLQPGTGWLCFTLTLLVQPVTTSMTTTLPPLHNEASSTRHVIVNDIMTLQPLTLPATAAGGPADSVPC